MSQPLTGLVRARSVRILARATLLFTLVTACQKGMLLSEFDRKYPANKAPMLYAKSRLRALENGIKEFSGQKVLVRAIELEPKVAHVETEGKAAGSLMMQNFDGVTWDRDSEGLKSAEMRAVAPSLFPIEKAPFERIPDALAAVTKQLEGQKRLDDSSWVDQLEIRQRNQALEMRIRYRGKHEFTVACTLEGKLLGDVPDPNAAPR